MSGEENVIGSLIREENGKIVVDWEKIAKMEGTSSDETVYAIYDHLINKGFLSFEPIGNYQLNDEDGVFLNPRHRYLIPLYFTRMEDAEAYKKAWFEGAFYRVNIIYVYTSSEGETKIKIFPEKESEKSTDSS